MNRYFNIFALMLIGILFLFSGCDQKKEVTGVTIVPDVCVLPVGETKRLQAIISPDNADDKSVRWTVSALYPIDTSLGLDVVSVEDGRVKGISEGFARIVCITNNFYEAKALVMVGYTVAVKGEYTGSLSKNGAVVNTTFKIGIDHVSEYEALLGLPFLTEADSVKFCPVTVSIKSDHMHFEGENTISIQGVMTPVRVTGDVTLDGIGEFEIILSTDPAVTTYSFCGIIENRPF